MTSESVREDLQEVLEAPVISWQVRDLTHAYKERQPTKYIVADFFALESLNIVYGAPGVMKSMLMADMCACIVAGKDWLPGSNEYGGGVLTTKAPVLWLDMDNGSRRTDERMAAVARIRDLPDSAPLHYISMPNPPFYAKDINSLLTLQFTIERLGVQLVVIDNLSLITGDVEENSSGMGMIMGYLRMLVERTGCSMILIHHQRKGGAGGHRAGDALRGHSSIEASIDLAVHIMREPNSMEVSMRSTKTRGVDVPFLQGTFCFEHFPNTKDLKLAWFSGKPTKTGSNFVRDCIVDIVKEFGSVTKGRLVDETRERLGDNAPGINTVRNWIVEMTEVTNELVIKKEGNAHVITSSVPF